MKQGSISTRSIVKLSAFKPDVPVISIVKVPGWKFAMSIESKVNPPVLESKAPTGLPPAAFASVMLHRSVLEPAVMVHA